MVGKLGGTMGPTVMNYEIGTWVRFLPLTYDFFHSLTLVGFPCAPRMRRRKSEIRRCRGPFAVACAYVRKWGDVGKEVWRYKTI